MNKQIYAQPSLFRRQKQEESSISYNPGPNSDLNRFIEKYGTLYDPETDNYQVAPFERPITTTKASNIFNMHSYHPGKKPVDAIGQYILHYTQPGDIVLDPFCGSGSTALAALMEGRAAVAIDLSPAATFITKNYCTAVNTNQLQQKFLDLRNQIQQTMDWLYETRCDRCDGRATTGYIVYSSVYQCPRCLEKVPLYDCVDATGQTANGKSKKIQVCPNCRARGHVEEISGRTLTEIEKIPVLVSYICEEGCKPKRDYRHRQDSNSKKKQYFEKYDLGKLQEINKRSNPFWVPLHRMMNVESDVEPWGDKWRAGTSNFRTVAELFTKRNLWALAAIRDAIQGYDPLLFAFSGIILNTSEMIRESNTQYLAGTFYIPPISKEVNVWSSYSSRVSLLIDSWGSIDYDFDGSKLLVSTQSATSLNNIPDNSVDYVFTDPPYAGTVQYGELNFIWEAWLDFDTNWHEDEIIINRTRGKSELDWSKLMKLAMEECFRVLKPGRCLSLCYHDTSEGTWYLVQDIMTEVGFIPQRSEGALFIDKAQKSYNQYTAGKVTKRDLVVNFRKPLPDEFPIPLVLFGDEDADTFVEKARHILISFLNTHPGSPSDRIFDELVSRMVRQGSFERHRFDELLRSVAEEVDGRWYLLETAGQVDAAESAKEEAAAARLEAFMQTYLFQNPGETGIHFSDLFEQNLYVQDKPRRDLKEWLPEFFFRTEAGTWRPPANEEEREQKAALRSTGTLRRIKRFGNALLEGVPPAERDRPENVATAGSWIRQCRRAGLYELGRALYEKGGFNFADLGDEDMLGVEEDYQICVRRS